MLEVELVEDGISNEGWRAAIMRQFVVVTQPIYRKLSRRKNSKWQVSKNQLESYPKNSLARRLADFLNHHKFQLMAQLESHDVFHVLLNYNPTVLDEARMQYCLVGSGRYSAYSLGTCLMAICVYPEYFFDFRKHFKRGRLLEHFSYWKFETLLHVDIDELKQSIKSDTSLK